MIILVKLLTSQKNIHRYVAIYTINEYDKSIVKKQIDGTQVCYKIFSMRNICFSCTSHCNWLL